MYEASDNPVGRVRVSSHAVSVTEAEVPVLRTLRMRLRGYGTLLESRDGVGALDEVHHFLRDGGRDGTQCE
jgi:hypothetical protein